MCAKFIPTYDEIRRNYDLGNITSDEMLAQSQARMKQDIKQANNDKLREILGNGLRSLIGGGLEAASFHPIFNIPYIGTGIGGAMFEMGDSINKNENAVDTFKNIGKGFILGETVGAIPYAGKAIGKTKIGTKLGDATNKAYQNLANSQLGQNIGQSLYKVGDVLMTDIKAFNPNKQTAWHGSPYDFEKFSNKAIGTGEGAQAHGLGHYAAKNRDIADKRYRQVLTGDDFDNEQFFYGNKLIDDKNKKAILSTIYENGKDKVIQNREKYINSYKYDNNEYLKKLEELNWIKSLNENLIKKDTNKGQLYELRIPKNDVMLREGVSFAEQPQAVQSALKDIQNDILQSKGYNSIDEMNSRLDALSAEYEALMNKPALPWESSPTSQVQTQISELERIRDMYDFGGSSKNIYDQLRKYYGDKTSELLNNKGIKGISYNGGIDGEANVIFNPDDIDIVRKYYNQPDLYDYLMNKVNIGGGINLVEQVLSNPVYPMGDGFKNYEKLGLDYYKNHLQPNPVEIDGYGIVTFGKHNKGKDDITNFNVYPYLREQLKTARRGERTNYNNETDRMYDYFYNNHNGDLYKYLIEDIKGVGKRYKKMRNMRTNK